MAEATRRAEAEEKRLNDLREKKGRYLTYGAHPPAKKQKISLHQYKSHPTRYNIHGIDEIDEQPGHRIMERGLAEEEAFLV